jgi:hypothetical protein
MTVILYKNLASLARGAFTQFRRPGLHIGILNIAGMVSRHYWLKRGRLYDVMHPRFSNAYQALRVVIDASPP